MVETAKGNPHRIKGECKNLVKFWSKWFRKFHLWFSVPTALLIPVAVIIKFAGSPELIAAWEKLDKIPSILMLIMSISGSYLFLLPYIVKAQRKKKVASTQE